MAFIPHKFEKRIIAFDYDGTLGEDSYPEHPSIGKETKDLIRGLQQKGYEVIIHTSRQSIDAEAISKNSSIRQVHTGKPIADLYIDDKGLYPGRLTEALVEQHFSTLEEYIEKLTRGQLTSEYAKNIENVPENPVYKDITDSNFKVYIPLTGGMDSTTLWQMAIESGYPAVPIYIDMGQEYADMEIEQATKVAGKEHPLQVVRLDIPFKKYDYILLGRNAVVIYTIAQMMKTKGEWGEVWFGNLAGESPIMGGDKSRRFFNDTQKLLDMRNFDVRIVTPLLGMDKVDEVGYWMSRDIDVLKNTKSCFSPIHKQCGDCQTCFRKWVAFKVNGIDIRETFARQDIEVTFQKYATKYKEKMGKALSNSDFSHYSPSRIRTTFLAIEELEK